MYLASRKCPSVRGKEGTGRGLKLMRFAYDESVSIQDIINSIRDSHDCAELDRLTLQLQTLGKFPTRLKNRFPFS